MSSDRTTVRHHRDEYDSGDRNPTSDIFAVDRPWGSFQQFVSNETVTVKTITVAPGHRLSLQRHQHRGEMWHVLDVPIYVTVNDRSWSAQPGETVWVPRGATHRMADRGDRAGRLRGRLRLLRRRGHRAVRGRLRPPRPGHRGEVARAGPAGSGGQPRPSGATTSQPTVISPSRHRLGPSSTGQPSACTRHAVSRKRCRAPYAACGAAYTPRPGRGRPASRARARRARCGG